MLHARRGLKVEGGAPVTGKMRPTSSRPRDQIPATGDFVQGASPDLPDKRPPDQNGRLDSRGVQPSSGVIGRNLGWSRLRPLLGDRRRDVVVLMIASVMCGITESGILAILAQTAVALVDGASRVHVDVGPLNVKEGVGVLLAIAIALALVRLALQWVVSVIPSRIAANLQAQLRSQVFAAFTRASWSQQSRDREGQLQELATNQIGQATMGTVQASVALVSLMSFLVLVVSALVLNVVGALAVLVAAVGLFAVLRPLSGVGRRYARAASQASLRYASGVNESVRVAEETQVFGVAAAQRAQVDGLVDAVRAPFYRMQVITRLVPGVYQSLMYLLIAGSLAALYATGAGHIASLGAVVLLLVRAGTYSQQAQGAYAGVLQALPYLERIQESIQRYADSTPVHAGRTLAVVHTLALQDVSMAYEPGRPVLSDITFEVSGRETVGIVGPTGAGKSTLVQILLGLREPSSGAYRINDIPATDFSREDWRRAVAYLPQEPRLLHASVSDNIRFFRELDDDVVEHAARLAGIHSEIVKWSHGYSTIIGPRADAVSGGQQQRICLARALAARPEVLVLDEPTSALDPHAELLIQESLATLKHELTLFVVAHRMSTLDICDRVMVIVDGRMQAFDTASALVSDSPYYRSASALAVGSSAARGRSSSADRSA